VGASLSVGALLGEPFLGIRKDMGRRAQGMDITLCEDLTGEFVGGSSRGNLIRPWRRAPFSTEALLKIMGGPFIRNSQRWLKEALEMGHLSLWVLCEGNLEGGLLYWGP